MNRTILPPWNEFRKTLGVEDKEPVETFHWLLNESDKRDLELAKAGLDSIDGSRDYVKGYSMPLEGVHTDKMIDILVSFGGHHSATSSGITMWFYKGLLNDWDNFVLKTKDREHRNASQYDKQQIHHSDIDIFMRSSLPETSEYAHSHAHAHAHAPLCQSFREKFGVSLSDEEMGVRIAAIKKEEVDEYEASKCAAAKRDLANDVDLLKFLYGSPIRWFSYEGGLHPFSVRNITSRHLKEMEELYPDYPEHYRAVEAALKIWNTLRTKPIEERGMPPAEFLTVFAFPHVENVSEMIKKFHDYMEHIENIGVRRTYQMKNYVLTKLFPMV